MRLDCFRILLSLTALVDWEVRQFNVPAAYIHGDIDEVVDIAPPPGYRKRTGRPKVWCRLLKGVYGLKQAVSGMNVSRMTR
jgi:Reverse transcriptase (RNA-dependent DNA polymerase)